MWKPGSSGRYWSPPDNGEHSIIAPHASDSLIPLYVEDEARRDRLIAEAERLPSILLNSAAAANAVMLGAGYFTPLRGFMEVEDALHVAADMHTREGLFWPVPVLNVTRDPDGIQAGDRIALRDPNADGHPVLAIQEVWKVETMSDAEHEFILNRVYRTNDRNHPRVATFCALGRHVVSEPIEVLNYSYFEQDFPDTFRTAAQIRSEIEDRGGGRSWSFRPATPCTAPTRLCAKWPKDPWKRMAC